MKKVFSILAASAVLTAGFAYAQTRTPLTANIPFPFRIGTTQLPAGQYTIVDAMVSGALMLRGETTGATATAISISCEQLKVPEEGKLVFHRYGNSYFLSRIWRPGSAQGRELPPSAAEREMKKAQNSSHGETELASVRAYVRSVQ